MTKEEAYDFVRSTFDDDAPEDSELHDAFVAIYEREPDEDDEQNGLWSLLCAATTGLCGCSTRSEHESVHISDGVETADVETTTTDKDAVRAACEEYAESYDHNVEDEDETHEVVARAKTCDMTVYFAFDSDGGFEWNVPASRYTTA